MTYEHIAIVSLLALQAATLVILYDTHKANIMVAQGMAARHKRIAITGNATRPCATLTGRYIKKDKRT
jgi:hypothetical protein